MAARVRVTQLLVPHIELTCRVVVVTHYEEENWCEVIDWDTKCEQFIPAAWTGGASKVLKSSCTAGDKDGNNKSTQSTVFCSASNSDVASDSWVTGFVSNEREFNALFLTCAYRRLSLWQAPTLSLEVHPPIPSTAATPALSTTAALVRIFLAPLLTLFAHSRRFLTVTSHHADEDWCTSNHWHDYCDEMKPTGSNVLLSSCQPGDKSGRDKETKSTVFCSVGNLDIPGQQTWITGFVSVLQLRTTYVWMLTLGFFDR